MILSNDCFIYDKCRKYIDNDCNLKDNKFCIKLFKLDYLYNESLLSLNQRKHINLRIDADGTDKEEFLQLKEIENNIEKFVKKGSSLYIYSNNCGNGKTAWAIRLIQSYFNSIWHKCDFSCKALFINVPKFLLSLKDNISNKNNYIEHIKNKVLDCDLVVWDELGTKVVTEFEHENLLNLINNRIDMGKCNIFTSNLSPQKLKDSVGERLYSRVVNLSKIIEFKGMDKRGITE